VAAKKAVKALKAASKARGRKALHVKRVVHAKHSKRPRKTKREREAKPIVTAKRPAVTLSTLEPERVLCLDVSSKCVGWAVFQDGELAQHGRYLQEGVGHGERLFHFHGWLLAMLSELEPTQLIYEAPYSGRMRFTFGVLSRYAGMVDAAHFQFFSEEIPSDNAVPAHLVKRAIGARKGASHTDNKRIVLNMVNQVFGLSLKFKENDATKKVSQDDEADAIALGWAWLTLYRPEQA
jgi:Holliday junction resolvasome RuvABC endonuclease subunit